MTALTEVKCSACGRTLAREVGPRSTLSTQCTSCRAVWRITVSEDGLVGLVQEKRPNARAIQRHHEWQERLRERMAAGEVSA